MFIKTNLVYKYDNKLFDYTKTRETNVNWLPANKENIDCFFNNDIKRKNVFLDFLEKGYVGLLLCSDKNWITYAWMSLPSTYGPPHLPENIKKMNVYWIFYCHTNKEYRGRGYYKKTLEILVHNTLGNNSDAKIFIDTESINTASRLGIRSSGFNENGIITSFNINIPRVKKLLWGYWVIEAIHPNLKKAVKL